MPVDRNDSCHCYEHDQSGSLDWFRKHVEEYEHDYNGCIAPCKSCNKPECVSDFKGKLYDTLIPPAFCEVCRKK